MSYEGWENYETWLVALWIGNDQGLYEAVREMADGSPETIKDFILEFNPLADKANLWSDLMNAALQSVNWEEIAADYAPEETIDS